MANKYTASRADLTSIADAIRLKAGTDAQLVFPDDFVTGIQGITGGGDLNFEIVGGAVQPENPRENTIWINTGTAITRCIFSEEEPTGVQEGTVWIETGENGIFVFNALTENALEISVVSVRQFIGTAFQEKDVTFYQNGAWNERVLYLYNLGDECEAVTGGYTAYAKGLYAGSNKPNMPTITRGEDYIEAKQTVSSASGILTTNNKISFAGFTTLYIRGSASSTGNCYVCTWPQLGDYAGPGHYSLRLNLSTTEEVKTADISGVQGEYYVGCLVYTSGTWLRIKEMWLE